MQNNLVRLSALVQEVKNQYNILATELVNLKRSPPKDTQSLAQIDALNQTLAKKDEALVQKDSKIASLQNALDETVRKIQDITAREQGHLNTIQTNKARLDALIGENKQLKDDLSAQKAQNNALVGYAESISANLKELDALMHHLKQEGHP